MSGTIVQFEFGEDGTGPVRVSSSDEAPIDIENIANRILTSEFSSDEGGERLLDGRAPPTNLSEYAKPHIDTRAGIESDD